VRRLLTTDEEAYVRASVAHALGRIGSKHAVRPLMKALLVDPESFVRINSAEALGEIRSEEAIEPLIDVLTTDEDSNVRERAAIAPGRIGSEEAIDSLIEVLEGDEDSNVRRGVADAFGNIGDKRAIDPLIKALITDENSDVRKRVATSLGTVGGENAIDPLIKALITDEEIDVQEEIKGVLKGINPEKAIQFLIKALGDAEEDRAKLLIIDAFSDYSGNDVENALLEMITHENNEISSSAGEALYKITSRDIDHWNEIKERIAYEEKVHELEHLNRIKDEFLSVASHELKAPLTPIIAALERMLKNRYGDLNEEQRRKLKVALAAAEEQRRLVENLLDLQRIKLGRAEPNLLLSNLKEPIEEAINLCSEFAEERNISIQIISDSEMNDTNFAFDNDQLRQIIMNLLSNTIQTYDSKKPNLNSMMLLET